MKEYLYKVGTAFFQKLEFHAKDAGVDMGVKKVFKYQAEMKIWQSLSFIAVLSVFTTLYQLVMQNGSNFKAYMSFFMSPLVMLFNFLPIFLIMTFIFFLTNRIWAGYLAVNLPLTVGLYVNFYKIYFRAEPFKPSDITLMGEVLNITENYKFTFNLSMACLTILMLFVFVVIFKTVHAKKADTLKRVTGIVVSAALLVSSYFLIYTNEPMYTKAFSLADGYNDVDTVSYKGLLYSFLVSAAQTGYQKPKGYTDEIAQQILNKSADNTNQGNKMPNVIAIMSEAFFDPQVAEDIQFYPGMDPLPNLNQIRKEGRFGNIFVPGFGGATASTEFEFLSGCNISLISRSMPTVYKEYINSNVYALPRMFQDLGFETLAIHPGHSWFYNRKSVYARMGFDEFITLDDLPEDVEKINYYTTDAVTSELIIDNYKDYLENGTGNGYFNFTVTIQNHGPYMDYETERPKRYVRPMGIDDKLYNTINNYMDGLSDADQLLGRVRTFIDTVEEPTVLVFFGDHLPFIDAEFKGYAYMGYDVASGGQKAMMNRYSIPFVIYGNAAAKDLVKSEGGEVTSGDAGTISASYLATELMEYMNVDMPPFFDFVNTIKAEIPIFSSVAGYYIDGAFTEDLPQPLQEKIDAYRYLQYYNLVRYGKKK